MEHSPLWFPPRRDLEKTAFEQDAAPSWKPPSVFAYLKTHMDAAGSIVARPAACARLHDAVRKVAGCVGAGEAQQQQGRPQEARYGYNSTPAMPSAILEPQESERASCSLPTISSTRTLHYEMANASKRALAASQSSQASSQASASQQRPAKRPRVAAPPAPSSALRSGDDSSSLQQEPSTLVSEIPETPSQPRQSGARARKGDAGTQDALAPLPPPKKRQRNPGKLRRLSTGHPTTSSAAVRPKSTLSGAKIGGKAKDLKDGAQAEEIWVKRQKGGTTGPGLGFAGYLKMGVKAFVERG